MAGPDLEAVRVRQVGVGPVGVDALARGSTRRRVQLHALGLYAAVALVVLATTAGAAAWMVAYRHRLRRVVPGHAAWWRAWANWDGFWYRSIAESGYGVRRGSQQAIAFFPSYPMVVRVVAIATGDYLAAGMVVTLASGLAAAVLFREWLRPRLSRPAAIAALLALFAYPYAFYLYGTLYADALYLACAIGAFVALERGHPWLAGIVGAVATGARPIAIVLIVGLLLRAWELSRDDGAHPTLLVRSRALLGVGLSSFGLLAYSGYLWSTRGNPLAFVAAEKAWHQSQGASTWSKAALFRHLERAHNVETVLRLAGHPAVVILALALVPLVFRRFGRAYGIYTALVIILPAITTKDLFGIGRYALAAFPCFAIAGELLVRRPVLRWVALAASGTLLILLTSQFARGAYVS